MSKTPWTQTLTLLLVVSTSPIVGCDGDGEKAATARAQGTGEESAPPAANLPPETSKFGDQANEQPWSLEASHTTTDRGVELHIQTRPDTRVSVREGESVIAEFEVDQAGEAQHVLHPTPGHHEIQIEAHEGDAARAQTRLSFNFTPPPYDLASVRLTSLAKQPRRRTRIECKGELLSEYGESLQLCLKHLVLTKRNRLHIAVKAQDGISFSLGAFDVPFTDGQAELDEAFLAVLADIKLKDIEKSSTLILPVTLTTRQRIFKGALEVERAPLAALLIDALLKTRRLPQNPAGAKGIALLYLFQRKDTWRAAGPEDATISDLDRVAFAVDDAVHLRRCRVNNKVRKRQRLDLYVAIYSFEKQKMIANKRIKGQNPDCPPHPWKDKSPVQSEADETEAIAWVSSYAGTFH